MSDSNKFIDKLTEKISRGVARRTSRRSLFGLLGASVVGAASLPLLHINRVALPRLLIDLYAIIVRTTIIVVIVVSSIIVLECSTNHATNNSAQYRVTKLMSSLRRCARNSRPPNNCE